MWEILKGGVLIFLGGFYVGLLPMLKLINKEKLCLSHIVFIAILCVCSTSFGVYCIYDHFILSSKS